MNIPPIVRKLLQNSPQAKNNPMAQQLLQLIDADDMSGIEQMGKNLCKTYNTSEEDAAKMAQEWASSFFGGNNN